MAPSTGQREFVKALVASSVLVWSCLLRGAETDGRQTKPSQAQSGPGASAPDAAAEGKAEALAAQKEFRRRGGMCMNSRVYAPARREARVPRDIGQTPVIHPRLRERRGRVICYAVDGDTLWAADDQALYQIDGRGGRLVRTFDHGDGLPDRTIQSIAPSGPVVWLATLSGLARLDVAAGVIRPTPDVSFTVGRLTAGANGVWLASDAGVYSLRPGPSGWKKLPEAPGQQTVATRVRSGFWWFRWRNREISLIRGVVPDESGVSVLMERTLARYGTRTGAWEKIADDVWEAESRDGTIWALCSGGVLRYDTRTGTQRTAAYGAGPADGRAVALLPTDDSLFVASHGRCDAKAKEFTGFTGGGISRLDLRTGTWSVTDAIDGIPVHFTDSLYSDGRDAWAGVMLYDKAIQRGAHPGMAHVKRWLPHPSGIGLARYRDGGWSLLARRGLKDKPCWIGPHGVGVHLDSVGPQTVGMLCSVGDRLWGACRILPEHWYGGYTVSAGCLAKRSGDGWEPVLDLRTEQLGLEGEFPAVMGVSRSHGGVWLAEGHQRVLDIREVAGRCWVIAQTGLYVFDPERDRFAAVVREPDRLYGRATAAVAAGRAVWFGGDGGTVSRLSRETGRLELVGLVPGRTVTGLARDGERLLVKTTAAAFTLPLSLDGAKQLPVADVIAFDGERWAPASVPWPAGPEVSWTCRYAGPHRDKGKSQVNYLQHDGRRVGFLRGVFRPRVLCEDNVGGRLWLASYAGVLSVPLERAGEEGRAGE